MPFSALPRGDESVLLVDDNDAVRRALGQVLSHLGYRVALARDAAAALAIASLGPIRLVIADVFLPGRNGPELVNYLRERQPGLKAILISGADMRDTGDELRVLHDVEFLQKPIASSDLAHAVRQILDR